VGDRRAPSHRRRRTKEDVGVVAVAAAAAGANNKADVAVVAELDAVVDKSDYLLFFSQDNI
jgi:hypothetical protein